MARPLFSATLHKAREVGEREGRGFARGRNEVKAFDRARFAFLSLKRARRGRSRIPLEVEDCRSGSPADCGVTSVTFSDGSHWKMVSMAASPPGADAHTLPFTLSSAGIQSCRISFGSVVSLSNTPREIHDGQTRSRRSSCRKECGSVALVAPELK
jgi:hypothetical protein